MTRTYRQSKRSGSADETREKIVRATFDLHGEQGVSATTMKQIAARAGVSVGSVYHHFPTYEDAIAACGAHAFGRFPPPGEEIFHGAADRAERVRRLALALFRFFAGISAFAGVRADAEKLPVLQPFVAQEAEGRLALARLAAGEAAAPTLAALFDVGAYEGWRHAGFTPEAAAARAAETANAWLDTQDGAD